MTKFLIGFFIGAILVALIFHFNPEKTHNYSVILNDGDTLIIPSNTTGYVGLAKTITTKPDSTVFDTFQYNHHMPGKSDIRQKRWSFPPKCNSLYLYIYKWDSVKGMHLYKSDDPHVLDTTWTLDTTYSSLFLFKNRIDSFDNIIDGTFGGKQVFSKTYCGSDSFSNKIFGDTPIANTWLDSAAFRVPLKRKKHKITP